MNGITHTQRTATHRAASGLHKPTRVERTTSVTTDTGHRSHVSRKYGNDRALTEGTAATHTTRVCGADRRLVERALEEICRRAVTEAFVEAC